MIPANPVLGVFLHSIGGLSAALFYTPHHKARKWSWETYWLVQSLASWLILPTVGALITIPSIWTVLQESPRDAMVKSFALGAAYGIGGTAFGLAIRYIGYSLTYAVAIGFSCVLGTLLPPLLSGELIEVAHKPGGMVVIYGVIMGISGMALGGVAGRLKERSLSEGKCEKQEFSFLKGFLLCLLSGFFSAVFNFALLAGQPIADVAAKHGAGMWMGNVTYIFAMGGAFVSSAAYCIWQGIKNKSTGEYRAIAKPDRSYLPINYLLASVGGAMWYTQFLFYGLAHVRLGSLQFSSWAIHMMTLIFFSNLLGVLLREWKSCDRKAVLAINLALVVLLIAVAVIGYGNYLGNKPA